MIYLRRTYRPGLRGFQFIFRRLLSLKEVMSIKSQEVGERRILIEFIRFGSREHGFFMILGINWT
jgi:hypothetical protein